MIVRRQVAAVVVAGHGEEFEARGDQRAAVAEVQLDVRNGVVGRVDRLGERDGEMHRALGDRARATSRLVARCRARLRGGNRRARSWR